MQYRIKKISGDASYRQFYRVEKNKKTSIIVIAKKEKFKNLLVYALVNNILKKNKILAPKLISNYYKNNMIEISDLGKISFYNLIRKKKNRFNDYKKSIELIIKLQKIKLKRNYKYSGKKIIFQRYSLKKLHEESDLFFNWYLKFTVDDKKLKKKIRILRNELNLIYKKLHFKNNFFTHRDFHASNIMIYKKKLSIIDSQDAIIGNPLYDVASLVDDVRIKNSQKLQNKLFNYYVQNSQIKKKEKFYSKNDFDILSVQRNLKILGIFVRLYKRDGKSNYLKYLPNTWSLIERRMKNPIFNKFKVFLKNYLPLKRLKKLNKL